MYKLLSPPGIKGLSVYMRVLMNLRHFNQNRQKVPRLIRALPAYFRPCNFIKKETLAQMFSCEICEIFINAFFYRTTPVAGYLW